MKKRGLKNSLIIKTLIFIVLVPGSVTVIIPYLILKDSLPTILQFSLPYYFGLLPALSGLIICFWCFADFINKGTGTPSPFDSPKQLVVEGLYRYVRNPMYIGISLVIFGEVIMFSSLLLILYSIILLLIFHINIVYYEEPKLRLEFGGKYDNYRVSVPRWFLKVTHKQLP